MNKEILRNIYKKKRDELFKEGKIREISRIISERIFENKYFIEAKNILLFYPKGSELNPLSIMNGENSSNKNFYLPVCCGDDIKVCPYKSGDKLSLNKYGIYEPETSPIKDLSILDLIITPALCADKNCNRIGYGKGYYDRFFCNKNLRAKKIIILPENFLIKLVPCDEFDKPCDLIITESNTFEATISY